MPSNHEDSSYDLRTAGRAVARLRGETSVTEPVEEEGGFVRFALDGLRFGTSPQPPPAPPPAPGPASAGYATFDEPLPASLSMMGSEGWDSMLEWCATALQADVAFIVDSGGLIVGASDGLPAETIEATGAHLCLAFDHSDQVLPSHGEAISISIELESSWLVGIRIRALLGNHQTLMFGLVSRRPLSQEARIKIAQAFLAMAGGNQA